MINKHLNLTYALKNGAITGIEEVESGLNCGCTCPACGEALVAKKGTKMMHHFAHHSGHSCEYGYESSLHLAAKAILTEAKKFTIPAVYVRFPSSYKREELVSEAKEITIDRVELEKRYGDIIPDIVIYAGKKQFLVEIFVTHRIDERKLDKLKKADISTIEIDLSKKQETITTEELMELLLGNSEEKTWIYNSIANRYLHRFYSVADKRLIVSRGLSLHVDYCPLKRRVWRGKPYANLFDDCLGCEYCVSYDPGHLIYCTGSQCIASIDDFRVPADKRLRDVADKINDEKNNLLVNGICPNCGSKLVERNSIYGLFWGCSNYPHCRFTASPDPKTGELKMKS